MPNTIILLIVLAVTFIHVEVEGHDDMKQLLSGVTDCLRLRENPNMNITCSYEKCALAMSSFLDINRTTNAYKFSDRYQSFVHVCMPEAHLHMCEDFTNFSNCMLEEDIKAKEEMVQSCATLTGAQVANDTNLELFYTDDKYACYFKCMLIKYKYFDESGEFNLGSEQMGLKRHFEAKHAVEDCTNENMQENLCYRVALRQRCFATKQDSYQGNKPN